MRQSAALLRWFTFLQLPWRPLLHLSFSIKIWKFFPFIIKSYAHAINDSMQQEFPYYSLKQDIFVYFFTLSTLSPPLPPIYQFPQVMGKSSCCREAVEVNLHINSWKYRTTSVKIKPLMEGALFFLVNLNMFWFDLLTKCWYVEQTCCTWKSSLLYDNLTKVFVLANTFVYNFQFLYSPQLNKLCVLLHIMMKQKLGKFRANTQMLYYP